MGLDTRLSNKNSIHVLKYRRCKTCLVEINVKNELVNYLGYAWNVECGL
jgi:hypothetical protein